MALRPEIHFQIVNFHLHKKTLMGRIGRVMANSGAPHICQPPPEILVFHGALDFIPFSKEHAIKKRRNF